jgi:hypothetical protein
MALRNLAPRAKQHKNGDGAEVIDGQATAGDSPPAVPSMTVSQATLDLLIEGRNELVKERQQMMQQMQQIDAAIQRQEGGIQLMQNLLATKASEVYAQTDMANAR